MTIATILFFAIFGVWSGFIENTMRMENIASGFDVPLDHGKLVERRVVIGTVWLFAIWVFTILFGQMSWTFVFYIPLAAGVFGPFHRITINLAAQRGPFYLGVDSKYDRAALDAVGFVYIYPNSAMHLEAWEESDPYRKKVTQAALLLYSIETTVALIAAYIIL